MTSDPIDLTASVAPGALFEGPYWSAGTHSLWWVDIARQQVFCRDLASKAVRKFVMPEKISAVVESSDGLMLCTGQRHLWKLDPVSGRHAPILVLVDEPKGNRCNDAKCDPHGNLWFGTMDDQEIERSGALWCFTASGQLIRYAEGIGISNTLAWDTARRRMYFGDSKAGVIYVMSYELVDGMPQLGNWEVFLRAEAVPGAPDGSALDADGNLWNARWGGQCVIQIDPEGSIRSSFPLRDRCPTSCAFFDADLGTLAVTTAAPGLDSAAQGAQGGRVLAIKVGAVGQAVASYGGSIGAMSATAPNVRLRR